MNTDEQIYKTLKKIYPNKGTFLAHMQFISKIASTSADFKEFLGRQDTSFIMGLNLMWIKSTDLT
jgi:hypothetical protein